MAGAAFLVSLVLGPAAFAADPAAPITKIEPPDGNTELDAETKCLALAVYWEGRAEDERGQAAIAHTVLNRTKSGEFPKTPCGVVTQRAADGKTCQFSWWCDGKTDVPTDPDAWAQVLKVARAAQAGKAGDPTDGALFFHNEDVEPAWVSAKKRVARIGKHVFYR
jgi:spore germination cell wall hydrolase CwlJ-like protein